ncbi:MAG: succinylglutamate desuccinylase/aspartoacylase family protein [Devosia sp.]
MATRAPFTIGSHTIAAGQRATVDLPVSVLSDHTPVTMSVRVIHGRRPGPTLFVSAAIHGDEVIGVEIARRVLRSSQLSSLRGTLMVVPIVNAFGFLNQSRYLPDRRDLNRSFPGRDNGSLASRLAHLFMHEIVARSDVGIDLHSAAIHRTNLPQVRIGPAREKALALAEAFAAPIVLLKGLPDGSLRQAAQEVGVDVLLYEAGEALRFDEQSARIGASGILRVMQTMKMLPTRSTQRPAAHSVQAAQSSWLRAPVGGLLRAFKASGEEVRRDDLLGVIADPFGEFEIEARSHCDGVIVGRTNLPVVNEGDALFHIAEVGEAPAPVGDVAGQIRPRSEVELDMDEEVIV